MTAQPSAVSRAQIAEFCRRNHIRRLSLFGSVLRPDFRPDSDIDVLVEFEPGHVPGLRFIQMQDELSRGSSAAGRWISSPPSFSTTGSATRC